jgi:hypothetical protein
MRPRRPWAAAARGRTSGRGGSPQNGPCPRGGPREEVDVDPSDPSGTAFGQYARLGRSGIGNITDRVIHRSEAARWKEVELDLHPDGEELVRVVSILWPGESSLGQKLEDVGHRVGQAVAVQGTARRLNVRFVGLVKASFAQGQSCTAAITAASAPMTLLRCPRPVVSSSRTLSQALPGSGRRQTPQTPSDPK